MIFLTMDAIQQEKVALILSFFSFLLNRILILNVKSEYNLEGWTKFVSICSCCSFEIFFR